MIIYYIIYITNVHNMNSDPDARQFIKKEDLAAFMEGDDKRREEENHAAVIDLSPIEHARGMPAIVRNNTRAAALDVQPDPSAASLELGHLQKLVRPLMLLIKEHDATPTNAIRPLHKLTIKKSKTEPRLGDEEYLHGDISEITTFMETQRYAQLAPAVKRSISAYLREQSQALQRLQASAEEAETDRTDVIKPAPRLAQDKPQEGRVAKFLKLLGLR